MKDLCRTRHARPWSLALLAVALTVVAVTAALPQADRTPAAAQPSLRSRYAVGVTDGDPAQVQALGFEWFVWGGALAWALGQLPDVVIPAGLKFPIFLPTSRTMDEALLRSLAARFPGTAWMVGNEPNIREMGNTDPETYADALAFYARVLKDADSTAVLIGPNVLNWDYSCHACPGFPTGQAWTTAMRAAYRARYGAEPPLDVWSLHIYDLDWTALPHGNAARQIEQVLALRAWLDAIPGLAGAPIWLTEVGLHWAYPGMEFRGDIAYPVGEFDYEHVERYLRTLFGWLNEHAERLRIEKWFIWAISWQTGEAWQSQWTGIALMDGPGADAPLTRLGRLYLELAGSE